MANRQTAIVFVAYGDVLLINKTGHIGRPIAGDARYGGALIVGGWPAPRLMLHAAALAFPHPAGGRMRLTAPVPADFAGLCQDLGLDFAAFEAQAAVREGDSP